MTRDQSKVVVLGMMTNMPVPGVVWQNLHYLEGFRRLGFDVFYVEAHARTPSMFVRDKQDDGEPGAAAFLSQVMERFDFQGKWAFHALHSDGRCYGMSTDELHRLYQSAELLINLHGGTAPLEEHVATERLLFLGTDPVRMEVELFHKNQVTVEFLAAHNWHFTFGENYGNPDCSLPVTDLFDLKPTRQPVILDWWQLFEESGFGPFTTVGNWRQNWREVGYLNDTYRWSKHYEFLKFLDLPDRTHQEYELALSSIDDADRQVLRQRGWRVRDALEFSSDSDGYRDYIGTSRGEFTVAKDQNVRFRSGWFSDRSATYLAAGRPVVTQDTGFGNVLPVGKGLFPFSTLDEAVVAIEQINADYALHRQGALDVAQGFFSSDIVLGDLLARAGISLPRRSVSALPEHAPEPDVGGPEPHADSDAGSKGALHEGLVIRPVRRCPTELHASTLRTVAAMGLPPDCPPDAIAPATGSPKVSIVMVTHGKVPFTKLCVESVIANTGGPTYELIVVDNGSKDGTGAYLQALARRFRHVDVVFNDRNLGFAAANNVGLARARGDVLVLLNNDTMVPPGWLEGLVAHLEDGDVGAAGPMTNRGCNEAQIEADYSTYGGLLKFAHGRSEAFDHMRFEIPVLEMFCFAMTREVFRRVGPIDERFGIGTMEDDDYSARIRELGLKLVCAEDVFVHHFGQASFGEMVPSGAYQTLLNENRLRFEEKWGVRWKPHGRRQSDEYREAKERIRQIVSARLPPSATVAVVSKGDDELLQLDGREAWHTPRTPTGGWAGWYPENSAEAIEHVESLRSQGAEYLLIPESSRWWLDFYGGLRQHLEARYRNVVEEAGTCTVYALHEHRAHTDGPISRAGRAGAASGQEA